MTAWPARPKFTICPVCRIPCDYLHSRTPDPDAFDHYYQHVHEAERERRGDPSPELIGSMQAREQLRQMRELEASLKASKAA